MAKPHHISIPHKDKSTHMTKAHHIRTKAPHITTKAHNIMLKPHRIIM